MNERKKKIMLTVQALLLSIMCAWSDMERWEKTDGSTFEAELIRITSGQAYFKYENGVIDRIPVDDLTEDSRVRAELADPPDLSIDNIKDLEMKNFMRGTRDNTQRPPERVGHYGIRIKQKSPGEYNHPLTAEMFIVGQERLGTGKSGPRKILLDHQTVTFYLKRESNRTFEYHSDQEVRYKNYQVWNYPRGEIYYGYLVVVTDINSNIVGVATSHDHLYENLDNLRKRGIKNYMNEECERVFPTRPPQQ